MSTGGEEKGAKASTLPDFATGEISSGKTADLTLNKNDGALPLEAVVVEAVEGPGKGARATLSSGTLLVGGDPACELPLEDPTVSRRHLVLELLPGAVRVRDLGSRNGTRYLGARIREARVPVGGSVTVGKTTLRIRSATAQRRAVSEREELHGLMGKSVAMRQLFAELERLGPQRAAVLIRGETGSGKEMVARALHALSGPEEQRGPFIVFDCSSVSPNLMESELFGHAKGSFTGADRDRVGAVESANGGTLFLDEIGELPLAQQPKLLRLLETQEFRRVGDGQVRHSTFRLLSATHRELEAEVRAKRFREDLYFRLAVTSITIPPLRERPEDIPLLAAHFARQLTGMDITLASATLAALQCDPWRGNVRELRNAVQRVVALGSLEAGAKEEQSATPLAFNEARDKLLEQFERDYLTALLARHKRNISAAARESRLSRSQFYRLLERHKLARAEDRDSADGE
ncbi:sigma 54-interacting transcriptional regulator [Hyalangium sp.]|uniref:sigma 54-interacting transcriptional regulator n=1 Tax=Hyalangium sp. TaxID=2028555 RepID=UPI002D63768C|nr:sigma 54-interacting transcriptional regulator [Hyalangium sp.]HYI02437.1 sigma 54-interacting transcriptional regulator [Hyalangium sp.]